ncbi:MAG: iron-sulfur protein, partial [Actinomycetota bacterium]|nr:iron-sulfur protein [Actinomycetota bacterium]
MNRESMDQPGRTRGPLRPSRVVLGLCVLFAAATALSGIVGGIESHRPLPVSRPVFWDVPPAMQVAFYAGVSTAILAAGWMLSQRVASWERGQPDHRVTTRANRRRRVDALWRSLTMRTLWRDPAAGMMHSLIYFPFLVLFAVTTTLEVDHLLPTSLEFLHGPAYQA